MADPGEQTTSPIAQRVGRRIMRLITGDEQVIAADVGAVRKMDLTRTSAGDSREMRRLRTERMRQHAQSLTDNFDRTRRGKYSDYREMEDEVPELDRSKQVLTDFVFGGDLDDSDEHESMVVEFGDGASQEVRDIVEAAQDSVSLQPTLTGIFEEGVALGDSFTELVFAPSRLVAEKPLQADHTRIAWDEFGRLERYLVDADTGFSGAGSVPLAPWQVLHYAPDRKRGHKYGRSTWASARKLWKAEQAGLDVMQILTLLRAAARKSVAYEVGADLDADGIQEWVESLRNGNWIDSIFDSGGKLRRKVSTLLELDDIVYPYRRGSEAPQFHNEPAANLTELLEVLRYYQERYFVATGVPAALAGMERNVNARATLSQQAINFVKTVKKRQREVSSLAVDILVRAALAAGVRPEPGDIVVRMPRVSTFDDEVKARLQKLQAQTAKVLAVDMQLDMRFVLQHVLDLSEERASEVLEAFDFGGVDSDPTARVRAARPSPEIVREQIKNNRRLQETLETARDWARTLSGGEGAEAA